MGQIPSGLVHGFHDQIEGDLAAVGEEVGQAHGVDGTHGGHGIALDAGDLHQAAHGIAGQTQMMLQGDFRRVFDLVNAHLVEFRQSGGRHGAGCADLRLTAAFRSADGGVACHNGTHQTRRRQGADHVVIGKSVFLLHIFEYRGNDTAGTAGGGRDDESAVRVLLADGEGVGAHDAVFPGLGTLVDVTLIEQILGLSLHTQSAGQGARVGQSFSYGGAHGLPHIAEESGKIRALTGEYVIGEADALRFAPPGNGGEIVFGIDLLCRRCGGIPLEADLAAADGQYPCPGDLTAVPIGDQIHGVGMGQGNIVVDKADVGGNGRKSFSERPVRAVTLAGLGQGSVQDHLHAVRRGIFLPKPLGGKDRAHGVGAGGAAADFIDTSDGAHNVLPMILYIVMRFIGLCVHYSIPPRENQWMRAFGRIFRILYCYCPSYLL